MAPPKSRLPKHLRCKAEKAEKAENEAKQEAEKRAANIAKQEAEKKADEIAQKEAAKKLKKQLKKQKEQADLLEEMEAWGEVPPEHGLTEMVQKLGRGLATNLDLGKDDDNNPGTTSKQ